MPDLDIPVLTRSVPESPDEPTFPLAIVKEPEPELTDVPLNTDTKPPVPDDVWTPPRTSTGPPGLLDCVVTPADSVMPPPVVEEPTSTEIDPGVVPPPVCRAMLPARAAAPVDTVIDPELYPAVTALPVANDRVPEPLFTDVPVCNRMSPVDRSPLAVCMITIPLFPPVLAPELTDTAPPVPEPERTRPADRNTSPPFPESLLPTTTLIEPLVPPVASPDRMSTQPLFPETDPPVLSTIVPLIPDDVTFAELNVNDPEPDDTLLFAIIDTAPPAPEPVAAPLTSRILPPAAALSVVRPALITIEPPLPLLPLPTTTLIDPPWPPVAVPLSNATQPLLPDTDRPVCRVMVPDAPDDPTSAVDSDIVPEPELTLEPLANVSVPPTPTPVA